jgi:hypothetical protein
MRGFHVVESLPRWQRWLGTKFAPVDFTRKGSVWKDGYHDGRALLFCLSTVRDNLQQLQLSNVETEDLSVGSGAPSHGF